MRAGALTPSMLLGAHRLRVSHQHQSLAPLRHRARRSSWFRVTSSQHIYEVRPRKDKRGVDLISDALPFGRLWRGPNAASNAIGYVEQYSLLHEAVIRVYDESGNVTQTHQHKGDFKEAS